MESLSVQPVELGTHDDELSMLLRDLGTNGTNILISCPCVPPGGSDISRLDQ